jgi:sigma-B regulation protein RsbU (phosphoserine phosphatase)
MLIRESLNKIENNIDKYEMLDYHVLEGMADWVRVVDKEGNIIYANKTMKEALGDKIVGMKCYLVTGKSMPCNFCITERSIRQGETLQKEEIINGKYFSVKSSPVKDCDGNIFAAVEVFRDVTRERRLELELVERNKKMSKDLGFAKRIQRKILPKKGKIGDINIDYIYKPSEMLSGDMFDVFHIDKENTGIYVSDVVGHGVAASMMTMFIRQTMRSIKDDILSPAIALTELHRRFSMLGLDTEKYFTIFYGVFNKSTHEFKYANAGHNSIPIKYNEDGLELLEAKGYPIALLFDKMIYDEKKVKLKKGDKVLLYTDGITEAKNEKGEEFGIKSVIDMISHEKDDLLYDINDKISAYSWGEQEDDFALILMEVIK